MSSVSHSDECKGITLLNRNISNDYDVIYPSGSDANMKKQEKNENSAKTNVMDTTKAWRENTEEMDCDTTQTVEKITKDRKLFRWKVLSASLLFLLLTLIGWTLYHYFGHFPNNCDDAGFSYNNCSTNDNSTNSAAISKYIWYRNGFQPCPEGWIFKEKSFGCYYVSNKSLTWTGANEFCRNMSSCLTNILSREDMNWLGNLTNEDMWVGGNQNGYVYQWECQQYNYQKQISPDSDLWASEEPKPGNTIQCVQIWMRQTGFWLDDHPCSYLKRFVCKSKP